MADISFEHCFLMAAMTCVFLLVGTGLLTLTS